MKRYQSICLLLLFYLVQIALCNPFVDFPINDDWSYAMAVRNLVEEGRLQYTGWTSMPLIVQVLWGSLFTLPFGFSHIALRLSTIVLAFAGGAGVYTLVEKMTNGQRAISFIVALFVIVNPYYNQAAFTFLTDIPFFAFLIWSVYFLVSYLEDGKGSNFGAGAVLLVLATLIRDITIVVPIAFAVAVGLKRGVGWRQMLKPAILFAAIVATIYLFRYFLTQTQGLPYLYDHAKTRLFNSIKDGFFRFLVIAVQYFVFSVCILALCMLPLTLLKMPAIIQVVRRKFVMAGIILVLAAATGLLLFNPRLPNILSNNILVFLYCGELDYAQERLTPGVIAWNFSPLLNTVTYYLAVLSVLLVFCSFMPGVQKPSNPGIYQRIRQIRPAFTFFIVFVILYLLLISPAGVFPRYLIPLMPMVAILMLYDFRIKVLPGVLQKTFVFVFLTYVYVGFGSVYDLMHAYEARKKAIDHLVGEMKISPGRIDGGFEFNGWHFYDPASIARPGQNWWWVQDDEYIVAISELKHYNTIYKVPYKRILPVGERTMYVMKKDSSAIF